MKTELVSVIINSYNGANYLENSINSVLNQSYKNIEIIFWDNASEDNTREIIIKNNFDKRFKYFYSKKFTKLYEAKCAAIKQSKGKYLAFLDVDDWWKKDKLKKQIFLMNKKKSLISCTNYFIFNEKKNKIKKIFNKNISTKNSFQEALKKYFVGMSTLVIERDFYNNLDYGFDKSFEVIGDFDLVLRSLKKTDILYIPEPMSYYRWHQSNLSNRKFRLNILELIRWKRKLEIKNFFSEKNLKIINDHLIYLIAIYYKTNNRRFNLYLFLKKINSIRRKILIILIFIIPKKIYSIIRS